jgi:hypothetical protein
MDNKIQLILIIVVSILVATNIFTYTRAIALEKDFNVKVEQIDTDLYYSQEAFNSYKPI